MRCAAEQHVADKATLWVELVMRCNRLCTSFETLTPALPSTMVRSASLCKASRLSTDQARQTEAERSRRTDKHMLQLMTSL